MTPRELETLPQDLRVMLTGVATVRESRRTRTATLSRRTKKTATNSHRAVGPSKSATWTTS